HPRLVVLIDLDGDLVRLYGHGLGELGFLYLFDWRLRRGPGKHHPAGEHDRGKGKRHVAKTTHTHSGPLDPSALEFHCDAAGHELSGPHSLAHLRTRGSVNPGRPFAS